MGCKKCGDKRKNKGKVAPRFTKCNFCGRLDVPLPLKDANKRGNRTICKWCILQGIGL